jgi:WD40 repeat protein
MRGSRTYMALALIAVVAVVTLAFQIRSQDHNFDKIIVRHGPVRCFAVSEDESQLVIGAKKQVSLWNLGTLRPVWQLDYDAWPVSSVVISDETVAASYTDGLVRIFDRSDGREVSSIATLSCDNLSVARPCPFSEDGRFVASDSVDGGLAVWSVSTGKRLITLAEPGTVASPCSAIAFSPESDMIAAVCAAHRLHLWDLPQGRKQTAISLSEYPIVSLALSGGARKLALVGEGGPLQSNTESALQLWDLQDKRLVRRMKGHEGSITSTCFSADGRFALSGSIAGSVRLWDVQTGKMLAGFHLDDDHGVSAVQFLEDSKRIMAGGGYPYWGGGLIAGEIQAWSSDKVGR